MLSKKALKKLQNTLKHQTKQKKQNKPKPKRDPKPAQWPRQLPAEPEFSSDLAFAIKLDDKSKGMMISTFSASIPALEPLCPFPCLPVTIPLPASSLSQYHPRYHPHLPSPTSGHREDRQLTLAVLHVQC